MMYYKEGVNLLYQMSTTKKILHKDSQEGSIISCVYYRKVLAWSTSKMIRLRYYPNFEDAGRNICCIDLPPTRSPKFPEYLYHQSTTIKPSIIFMKSKQQIHDPHPSNTTLITTWYNMIKVTELIYDPGKDKYTASAKAKKSITRDDIYLAGSSFFEVEGQKSKHLTI